MTITGRGVQVIQDALDHIHNHPEEWNQSQWMVARSDKVSGRFTIPVEEYPTCGTACCFAGRVTLNEPEFGLFKERSPYSREGEYLGYDPDNPRSGKGYEYYALDQVMYKGYGWPIATAVVEFFRQFSNNWNDDSSAYLWDDEYVAKDNDLLESMFNGENNENLLWSYGQKLTGGALRIPEGVELCVVP